MENCAIIRDPLGLCFRETCCNMQKDRALPLLKVYRHTFTRLW